jgi:hypothetical protein
VPILKRAGTALHEQGLVDRLVGHTHLRVVGKVQDQPSADLFRAPLLRQLSLHMGSQPGTARELARLRSGGPLLRLRAWAGTAR